MCMRRRRGHDEDGEVEVLVRVWVLRWMLCFQSRFSRSRGPGVTMTSGISLAQWHLGKPFFLL